MFLAEAPFVGFQGEGNSQGKLSLFVRFAKCNLTCQFCDSKFSWSKGAEYSCDNLKRLIMDSCSSNIIFTGGEPLLDSNVRAILEIIDTFPQKTFEIETNGTIVPTDLPKLLGKDNIQFNISPKENISQTLHEEMVYPKLLEVKGLKRVVKFLFDSMEDLDYINIAVQKFNLSKQEVYIQPKGISSIEIQNLVKQYYNSLISLGCNLSIRSHVMIFENKQGV